MYNSGNSSKNVRGSAIIDGTVEAADLATAVNNDIADGVAGKATADLALPKAGGAMTGAITTNSTFDGRDVATDGAALDVLDLAINSSANATAITIDASENVDLKRDLTITSYDPQKIKFNRQTTSLLADASVGRIEMYSNDVSGGGTGIASYIDARTPSNGTTFDLIFGTKNYGTDATEKMRILATGGITFNGDTAAANALDDYEEGTWIPTQTVVGAVGSVISANYRKIGSLVYFQFDIIAATTADTGQFQVVLPFTPVAFSTIQQFACSLAYTTSGANVAEVKGGTGVMLRTSHGGGNMTNATASGTRVIVSGSYIAA